MVGHAQSGERNSRPKNILSVVKEQAKTFAENLMYQELDAWRKRAAVQ